MQTVIIGAGPTGLYSAIALARRGHRVTLIDRDPGPNGGRWHRKGVMQFHHPHHFRQQVADALLAEMPEVWPALLAAGAQPATLPGQPAVPAGLHCRRLTFERVLRSAVQAEPGVKLRTGHVDEVCRARGRVTGVKVSQSRIDADLVIDAGGRAGRLNQALRGRAEGGDCGVAYVSRQYEMLPGAALDGPVNAPFGVIETYPGYLVAVFIHDNRILSALIARASTDRELAGLRTRAAFDAAARAIPALAAWTDPARSRPVTPVLPGGRLYNNYRGQLDDAGRVALDGLIYVGDAVCTTNPTAGRGVTTSLLQAQQLIGLLDEHGSDFSACSLAFDQWCTANIKPWFHDHVRWDADLIRRWSGQDIDLTRPLPSDLIVAAAQADPQLNQVVGPYQGMHAPPGSLDAIQARARDIYATGWRPPVPPGPTRDQLASLITAAQA